MGPLRRYAVLVVLLLAAACGDAGPSPDRVLSATGAASEQIQEATTTSTTVRPAATSTTGPPTRAPTTTSTARPPAASTTAKPADAAPRTRGPYPPGVSGTTLTATTTSGDTALSLSFFPADQYFGEIVQVSVELATRDAVRSVKVDFGNGKVVDVTPPGFDCPGKVRPLYSGAPMYTYPAPGRYVVKAIVTLVPCIPFPATPPPGFPTEAPDPFSAGHSVEVAVTYDQAADRPPRPVGPPPGA